MPYLCIKTVSITTCNVDNVKCWQKCLSIFILFLCRLYKKNVYHFLCMSTLDLMVQL